ncbi:quinone oxidoreductase family protein [Streptomyces sp. TLI_55]|uniref:quinone oxidoreductase family protein n=1 Tax=Streptomyces sp. TLI_55 TaxID=1938861 RepID=UPI0027B92EC9|nr:zinc-binding dehydrogenase [Streptomyces sp. TLI_55]
MAFNKTGGPEVLHLVDLPTPTPGPDEILLRVAYAGVNYGEIQHRLGDFGEPEGETVTGLEAAGVVAAVGERAAGERAGAAVSAVSVGDRVAAYLPDGGGYAEYVVVPAAFAFPLPDALDLRTGGAAALVLTTAYGVLAGAARLAPGDTVLIHAAAGGVGGVAAQLARALGARAVYGTVSTPEKAAYARAAFGYDEVFVRDDFPAAVTAATSGRGVDVVLDPVGGPTRLASLDVLAPFGRVAVYGEAARHPDLQLPVLPLWKNNRTLTGYNIGDLARRAPETLRAHALNALSLAAAGAVRLDITEEHDLTDAAKAHRLLGEGRNRGKTVLRVDASSSLLPLQRGPASSSPSGV